MKLSIAVPWYKSPGTVLPLYNQCMEAVAQLPEFTAIEFVFVEDGGQDQTWQEIAALAKEHNNVKAMRLSRNFGQHHALTACLDLCDGDWVVVMDCDLQDRPGEIPLLWAKAREGYDMVCARRGRRKDKIWKRFTSLCFGRIFTLLSGMKYDSQVGNFRIMSKKVVLAFRQMREATRNMGGQLQWLGFKVGYVDVRHGARYCGESSYTIPKLISLAVDSIIAYSDKPLRIFCALGSIFAFFAFIFALYIIMRKLLWGIDITGWTSLIISIWFLGGLLLASIGFLGLYIGHIYFETKHRPIYIVAERINC